ncbi:hypothetical protein F2Q69_00037193, partial [Brassica cretica]
TYILISMLLDTDIFEKLTRFSGAASKLSYRSPKAGLGMRDIALPSHRKKEYEVKDENLRGPKPRSVRLQLSIPSSDVHVGESPVESSNNVVALSTNISISQILSPLEIDNVDIHADVTRTHLL